MPFFLSLLATIILVTARKELTNANPGNMDNYISQLKQSFGKPKQDYVGKLRKSFEPNQEPKKEESKGLGVDEQELRQDILDLRKEGHTLEEVEKGIDSMDEINDKNQAKEIAKQVFGEPEEKKENETDQVRKEIEQMKKEGYTLKETLAAIGSVELEDPDAAKKIAEEIFKQNDNRSGKEK